MSKYIYDSLAERLGFAGSKRLIAIFESLLTPEAAAMIVNLPALSEKVKGDKLKVMKRV